jgi:hypothetical protein
MLFDEAHEVRRSVTGERRLREVWIGGKKIFRAGMQVGEVAAPAARNQNFLADPVSAFQQQNASLPLTGLDGTHQAGGASSEDDDIVLIVHAEFRLTGQSAKLESAKLQIVIPGRVVAWFCNYHS